MAWLARFARSRQLPARLSLTLLCSGSDETRLLKSNCKVTHNDCGLDSIGGGTPDRACDLLLLARGNFESGCFQRHPWLRNGRVLASIGRGFFVAPMFLQSNRFLDGRWHLLCRGHSGPPFHLVTDRHVLVSFPFVT